jgi:hypothetical protein
MKSSTRPVLVELQVAEGGVRIDHRHRRRLAMGLVKGRQLVDVHVRQPVTIGQHEGAVREVMLQHLQPPAGHRLDAGVDQVHHPGRVRHVEIAVGVFLPVDLARGEIDPEIAFILAELGDVFLDRAAHVAERQHEVMMPVDRVMLHDMPQKRPAADFDQGFGTNGRLFDETGPFATCKNCDFHRKRSLRDCRDARAGDKPRPGIPYTVIVAAEYLPKGRHNWGNSETATAFLPECGRFVSRVAAAPHRLISHPRRR